MNNLLGDILETVSFKSAVYFKYGFCSPWGMDVTKGDFSQFHLVTGGNCYLKVEGQNISLEKGDIVIFPKGAAHQIKDKKRGACRSGMEVVTEIMSGGRPFESEGEQVHLICGHYEMDWELSHPVFENLPDYVIVKSNDYGRFDLIYSIFELLLDEWNQKRPGFQIVSLRLAEILFISIIRHYYTHQAESTINLFKDEAIYKVVDFIHRELNTVLNIEKLARHAGLSRTLFIERFKQSVGATPLQYIINWRMTKAKYLLKTTDLSLAEVGAQVGYSSEASFQRVFKGMFGVTPGTVRK